MVTRRGLVLVPRFRSDGAGGISFADLDPFPLADLRRYTLYWDRLDLPENNVINFEGPEENPAARRALVTVGMSPGMAASINYLQNTGVLQRSRVVVERPKEVGSYAAYLHAQLEAFRQLEAKEPGLWAMGQSAVDYYAPSESAYPTRTVEIGLFDVLPLPPDTVSLADVLEFRTRRTAELLSLRTALDDLYRSISSAGDVPRARTAALDRLERSLAEVRAVVDEAWSARVMSSLKIELNLPEIAAKAAIGIAVAVGIGVPAVVGAAVGAATAGSVKINVKELFAPKLPPNLRDFAYVYHQMQDLR